MFRVTIVRSFMEKAKDTAKQIIIHFIRIQIDVIGMTVGI
jgi:hypothetical protein